jgi:Flp pilus assembly secretin CpaC
MTKHMNSKQTGIMVLALAAAFTAFGASAAQRLVVEKNHSARISLNGAAGSVIVANPAIADVNIIDSRTVYIVGKGFGNSSVIITDQMGRPLFDGEVVVTASQKGAITVYKGLTPSLMVCSTICTSEEAATGNASPAALGTPVAANP